MPTRTAVEPCALPAPLLSLLADAQGDAQPPGEEQPHAGTASGGAAAAAPPGQPLPADDEQGGFEELDAGLDEYEDDEQVGFEEVDVVLDGYEQDADVDAHVRFEEVDAGLDGYDYDGADEEHAVFVDAEHGFELGGDEEDLDWDLNEDEEDMEEEGVRVWCIDCVCVVVSETHVLARLSCTALCCRSPRSCRAPLLQLWA